MSVLLGDKENSDGMEEEQELTGAERKAAGEVDQKMQLLRKWVCTLFFKHAINSKYSKFQSALTCTCVWQNACRDQCFD